MASSSDASLYNDQFSLSGDILRINNGSGSTKTVDITITASTVSSDGIVRPGQSTAKKTFSENSLGSALPSISIRKEQIQNNFTIIDLIIMSKLENSKSEIRRLIKGNGVKINNKTVNDEKLIISQKIFKENVIKLSLGKKRHIKVEII